MSGRNFDDLAGRFKSNIYGTRKGQLRLDLLWEHIEQELLPLLYSEHGDVTVFDAGCGMAQISKRLIQSGCQITLCDKSIKMLNQAKSEIGESVHCEFIHASFQDMHADYREYFDLVMSHAVLEWLDKPEDGINALGRSCKPGGYLSLLFYNRDSYVFRNLIRGNWKKVESNDYTGHRGGLTPNNPVSQTEVLSWLESAGFVALDTIGLRSFFDYMSKEMQLNREYEDILRLERMYSRVSPYRDMARYIHIIARKL
ncbi:MAG: methyltransferase domain-containing protein [Gammaproteobacteria bacterium]|nr:methyltransferase domain-containing protein [Gammaproteobacteria bacterium]